MFSDFVDGTPSPGPSKKARIQRACDICRKKKIRCDGVEAIGKPCTQCAEFDYECTYHQPAKKRGRPRSYVESLENRIDQLEKIIQRLCPNDTVYKGIIQALDKNQWTNPPPAATSTSSSAASSAFVDGGGGGGGGSAASSRSPVRHSPEPADDSDEDDDINNILAESLKQMQLEPPEYRFFGKSSGLMLVRAALDLKSNHVSLGRPPPRMKDKGKADKGKGRATMKSIRMEYWMPLPWELRNPYIHPKSPLSHSLALPEPDLAEHLIAMYFSNMHIYIPMIHKPSFDKWVQQKLYLSDDSFACVYLLVCAVGARYSDDPRCLIDGINAKSPHATHSNGWKWFHQVQALAGRRNVITPPNLFDIQYYALSAQFLVGSSVPQAAWTMIGCGIRVAQDVGVHRKKANAQNTGHTAEEEMLKRAFWTLVCMDGIVGASLGRSCAIHDEDFDLDLPIDCDDEYWDADNPDPEKRFKQPPGKPSTITMFILLIKLYGILQMTLRTIYTVNKSAMTLKLIGTPSEQTVVAEIDSTLNKFADSIPEHLIWDPANPHPIFFQQSASLYALYYHAQILVHRPFIPSPTKPSPVSMPSMAMCTNAARSCCRMVDAISKRGVYIPPQTQMAVFTSAMVLLLSVWGSRQIGLSALSPGIQRDMEDVHKCMNVLRASESRWHIMGRLWDILYELASAGELLPDDTSSPQSSNAQNPLNADMKSQNVVPSNVPPALAPRQQHSVFNWTHEPAVKQAAALSQHVSHSSQGSSASSHIPSPSISNASDASASDASGTSSASPPNDPPYSSFPDFGLDMGSSSLHTQFSFSPFSTDLAQDPSFFAMGPASPHGSLGNPNVDLNASYNLNPSGSSPTQSQFASAVPSQTAASSYHTASSPLTNPLSPPSTMPMAFNPGMSNFMPSLPSQPSSQQSAMNPTPQPPSLSSLGDLSNLQNLVSLANLMGISSVEELASFASMANLSDLSGLANLPGEIQNLLNFGAPGMNPVQNPPPQPQAGPSGFGLPQSQPQLHQQARHQPQQPQQPQPQGSSMPVFGGALDNTFDLMSMWSNTPTSLSLDDWDVYLTNVGEMMHQSQGPSGGAGNMSQRR